MYKILKAETLAAKIHLMVVHAPRVASHCQPGQFIIVKMDEKGERIPLTICDYDREEGTVTIVFQEVGASTIKMSELKAGDSFRDFVGPLGCPSEFVHEDIEELKKKKMVFIAGGVGTAPVYPQVKWLKEHGITADVILGSKTKDMVILEKELAAVSNLYVTTDDGSYGRSGMVTKTLEDLVTNEGSLSGLSDPHHHSGGNRHHCPGQYPARTPGGFLPGSDCLTAHPVHDGHVHPAAAHCLAHPGHCQSGAASAGPEPQPGTGYRHRGRNPHDGDSGRGKRRH